MESSIGYKAVQTLFQFTCHLLFRELKITGAHHIPTTEPCIFIVAPHSNQFIDPCLFMGMCPRPTYAIMAASACRLSLVGQFGKILNAIPVVRPQDVMSLGSGQIRYNQKENQIEGKGTQFLSEVHVRDSIVVQNKSYHVVQVTSNTILQVLHVNEEQEDIFADYQIMPYINQSNIYEGVHNHLNQHHAIALFPEGASHDQTEILPLRAGFAVMALGAAAKNAKLDVKLVPVGLNYSHPERFRSKVVISYGQPFSLDPIEVEQYRLGDRKHAVNRLLERSDQALKRVIVNAPNHQTLTIIRAARRLYLSKRNSFEQAVETDRCFVQLWAKVKQKNPARLDAIEKQIELYQDSLHFLGIKDDQVDKLNTTPVKAVIQLTVCVIQLILLAGLCTPAFILNLPLIWILKTISKRKQKELLASSRFRITGKDVVSTWRVIPAVFIAPIVYSVHALCYLSVLYNYRNHWSLKVKLIQTGYAWLIQPVLSYLLIRFSDKGIYLYRFVRPLYLAISNPRVGNLIQTKRQKLSEEITKFVHEYSPELEFLSTDSKHQQRLKTTKKKVDLRVFCKSLL
ncbi:hypothetical protein A0J61_05514 [Choanephora cucurbitarum]|uniref:Phospholipid/glycerol acyltransferase domain-containing protein n=1 Tax=Choanephora cucurbitarum TaxID=101091 RepID=A0A1C7NBR8_9FUNG|nr:hypothetical protein A0J61_05514 [Choanephora cucurbitarum]